MQPTNTLKVTLVFLISRNGISMPIWLIRIPLKDNYPYWCSPHARQVHDDWSVTFAVHWLAMPRGLPPTAVQKKEGPPPLAQLYLVQVAPEYCARSAADIHTTLRNYDRRACLHIHLPLSHYSDTHPQLPTKQMFRIATTRASRME